MNGIDWNEVWETFDYWYETHDRTCECCGKSKGGPDWDEQQQKIAELVNLQLTKKGRR